MNIKLAGVVILYNPEIKIVDNIKSYLFNLDKLYIVNNGNGGGVTKLLIKEFSNIEVIDLNDNMGISKSLNMVLEKAYSEEVTHLLMMDQDSQFYGKSFLRYKELVRKIDWDKCLQIGCKLISYKEINPKISSDLSYHAINRLITSGSIISIQNAIKIGAFDEKLFIDEVDFEFCYRGLLKGYILFQTNNSILLRHSVGSTFTKYFWWGKITTMNHNKIRKYYIVRNRMYVYNKYHKKLKGQSFFRNYIQATFKDIVAIMLAEDDKIEKLRYCVLGFRDFWNNKMGKLEI